MAFLREPIDEPRLISSGLSFPKLSHVCFFHPGYGSPGDDSASHVLLSLRAFDDGGVHYMTAHTACAIIAGNRWDGYFSHDRDEAKKIRPPRDGILREKSYYFWVPSSSTDPYPVIARFNDWRFPHNNLPPLWTQFKSQLSANEQMNEASNGYCCLSNYGNSVESAHLVPVAQSHWWMMNNMDQYCETTLFSTDPINALANRIALRSDIHRMFDERNFTFTPKFNVQLETSVAQGEETPNPETGQTTQTQEIAHLVGHVFKSTPCNQLPYLWHNRRVHALPSAVSVECLFARFAWTIFSPGVFLEFLRAGKTRRILVWNHELEKQEIEEAGPERCRSILAAARSRSESPRKRSRSTEGVQQDNNGRGELLHEFGHPDAASDIDIAYQDEQWLSWGHVSELHDSIPDEPERGRRRKRKSEETLTHSPETGDFHKAKRVDVCTV